MFKWLNTQGVEKDGEFSLQRIDRFHYEYGENGHKTKIAVEPGNVEDVYLSNTLNSASEHDGKRITDNIIAALKFMRIRFNIR